MSRIGGGGYNARPGPAYLRMIMTASIRIGCASILFTATVGASAAPPATEFRVPENPAVVRMLTATQGPTALYNAPSKRIAMIFRETLVPVERIARPHIGLAGFWFDPVIRTSGYESWVERVTVLNAMTGATLATWQPPAPAALDAIDLSPDGRHLSAVSFREGLPRLVLFDIDTGKERVLPVAVNPAFEAPCTWTGVDDLLCRVVPDENAEAPTPFASPNVIDHPGGEARTRTYGNLLENAYEEALFEHYFSTTLAHVALDGEVRRIEGTTGLLARVRPSPDRSKALVVRLQRPYSHLLKADNFPRQFEIWDLVAGKRVDAPRLLQQRDITPTKGRGIPTLAWQYGTEALGWTEPVEGGGARWLALDPPYGGEPREIVRNADGIAGFGWTDKGTAYFSQRTDLGTKYRVYLVNTDGEPQPVWEGAVKDVYDSPGVPIRTNGNRGPVLEYNRHIFMTSDGLSAEGPQPFVDALNLDTLEKRRVITAPEGIYERVLGIIDAETRTLATVRESETEPPQLFAARGDERTPIGGLYNPFPELDGVLRKNVSFQRKDGVTLNGMLYLPKDRDPSKPLPTLVWIYPAEFADEEYAEQMDSRRFRFHQIKEASPIAAVLNGYALLLNPTVPIIGEGIEANDAYVPSLISSMEAAIDYLVGEGISDRDRMAVAGRSYGAFSTANLLVHSDLFKTGIAVSGAYNRTLTPFGFQHEKRSFWEAMDFYTRMSPFYYADRVNEPILIMHGGADDNPGTPTLQARRFVHALVGNGARVRYVELPFERHHYRARENVLHASAEMLDWLDHTIGPKSEGAR
jgi:dipeptidyl aminopeptidase/acylaminoacyl peptidase